MLIRPRPPPAYALSHIFGQDTDIADGDAPHAEKGDWWVPNILRRDLKELMRREDRRPLGNYLLWLALLCGSGLAAYETLGHATGWSVGAFFIYGTIYSSCDPRSHDLGRRAGRRRAPW